MVIDDIVQALHDKATRGVTLSPDEQVQLDQWYMAQDADEHAIFALTITTAVPDLRPQLAAALAPSTALTQRIRDLTNENEALRSKISLLRQRVARVLQST